MQKQFKYIYNNQEVSKEEFEKLAGDSFKWFDGDSIVSVPFSSFDSFLTGDFKSGRQINDHLDSVLDVYKNKVTEDIINKPKCSPQCYCDGSCKKPQEKKLGGYNKPTIKGNSTRHKSQAGETHKENFLVDSTPLGITGKNRAVVIELDKDDVITSSNRGEKEVLEALNNLKNTLDNPNIEIIKDTLQGTKESEGKLNYELDWDFIQQMAERMSQNKGKYKPYNWTKPMSVEKLKQSLFRHVIEVMKGNYSDDGRDFGHFESIALNAMMINYQLKNNSK